MKIYIPINSNFPYKNGGFQAAHYTELVNVMVPSRDAKH